jgi:hypothetical protein
VVHDGAEGLSPDGWLPDRISIGVLTRAFPPELVDEVIEATGTREQRRRLLPARLMVYFVLALWLFRGRNCGYGQVMAHRRRRERRGHPSGPDQLPARTGRRDRYRRGFPPDQLDLALATFPLKILMPGFRVRDRPDRAGPRKTKKAGDFPARNPAEPSVTNVTRRIELHLLYPWQIT